jgi:hypothetical protein
MWLRTQMLVMIAVGWTGIYFHWTHNGVALGIVAVGAAYCVTRWPKWSVLVALIVGMLILNRMAPIDSETVRGALDAVS